MVKSERRKNENVRRESLNVKLEKHCVSVSLTIDCVEESHLVNL